MKRLGLDIGSTTLKCVVLSEQGELVYAAYRRHLSKIPQTAKEVLGEVAVRFPGEKFAAAISGSAGMGIAKEAGLPFVQEVFAEKLAVTQYNPGTDAVIELGGEDAKILFLSGGFEMRMNGSCAGGTGAFIDQMASLLQCSTQQLNDLAAQHEKICTIASRCGVFAKSDVQPLLNQGTRKEDIAAGILYAVVGQTVSGLAQGRKIAGNVLYLGGPLSFLSQLRAAFDDVLGVHGVCPEHALYYVALGAALAQIAVQTEVSTLLQAISNRRGGSFGHVAPLFSDAAEYEAFCARHAGATGGVVMLEKPAEQMYLGVDAGSTTVKAVLCDQDGNLFRPFYAPNQGSPIPLLLTYLQQLYQEYPSMRIVGSAATGYGEELVKHAFSLDYGVVETMAHYMAAKKCQKDVDFIIDIGGQDIKCFRICNGMIEELYLNEACSSGCGSFLQTFAAALGYTPAAFAQLGLFAREPVELGSRCTVFMNSAVKQAQKDGAGVEDIAAGLSISVVKNALYKVIRCADPSALGEHIVVQGGTFLNDCVLRAFERELDRTVTRPVYAPLMGAYGAALYAMEHKPQTGTTADAAALAAFRHTVRTQSCGGCTNHCTLTINAFSGGRRYIAGNRCSRPLDPETRTAESEYNLYRFKQELLAGYMKNERHSGKCTVGLPMGLNNYELLPFWHTFFRKLDCNVLVSPFSDHDLYLCGQQTIPSDTVCYPAKLMHGHIEWLLHQKPDYIFYPDMTYNIDEGQGVDHYNCPVVAYYPQVLKLNVSQLQTERFICDFVSLAKPRQFVRRMTRILQTRCPSLPLTQQRVWHAARDAYDAYAAYLSAIRQQAEIYLQAAAREDRTVIVLAGRPYHVDPQINHGIDRLLCSLGAVVLTEDSISDRAPEPVCVSVRNQWTYHARLYAAASYIASRPEHERLHLVQLVSFGCGVDAITADEVRSILQQSGKDYTQIKIDEISNMGAVTIRLRSLFAVIDEKARRRTSMQKG